MAEERLRRESVAPDVQANAGVGARAMPVASISLKFAERCRYLRHSRFQLLQANDIRALALDPLENLSLAGADPIDIPGGDFQHVPSPHYSCFLEFECKSCSGLPC